MIPWTSSGASPLWSNACGRHGTPLLLNVCEIKAIPSMSSQLFSSVCANRAKLWESEPPLLPIVCENSDTLGELDASLLPTVCKNKMVPFSAK